jgi:putative peptidoglycan lipid II flippase
MPDSAPDTRYGRGGLAQNAVIVMVMTVASGLLGLLRESVFASRFGTGDAMAAYKLAYSIPDLIYVVVIGGALGSAFIPVFTAYLARRDDAGAWRLASTVLDLALVAVIIAAGLTFLLAPWLVRWIIAPAAMPSVQDLVVQLTRVLLIQPILLGIGGLAMAALNSFRRFLLTALAPLVYNLSIIAGALFLAPYWGIYGLIAGVLAGAALYLPVLLPGLFLCRMRYTFSWDWRDPGVREVGRLLLPRLLGQAAFQVNFIAIKSLATFSSSLGVTAIDWAYRLFYLPLNILGISLGTVAFPTFAALVNEGRPEELRRTLSQVLRVVFFLTLPAAALMFVLRQPLIALLFQHGAFTPSDTEATARAFLFFVVGLTSGCVTEIAVRAFYALHDTRTPVLVGAAIVALNVALGAGLSLLLGLGYVGLAISFTITNTIEPALLVVLLRRRIERIEGWALLGSGLRSLGAAVLGAAVVAVALPYAEQLLPGAGLLVQFVRLAGLTVLGGGLYLGAALLLRSPELGEAWALLRRRGMKRES